MAAALRSLFFAQSATGNSPQPHLQGSPPKGAFLSALVPVMEDYSKIFEDDEMDATDMKILGILQEDASLPIGEIASRVGLSQTPCWRRIQKLEAAGVIRQRVALLNPSAIGVDLTVFVELETGDHSKEWLDRFANAVRGMPEVMEMHRMAGDVDYLLRVAVANMAAYDNFYRQLIALLPMKNVTSRFTMELVKSTTAYPLPAIEARRR